MTKSLFPIEMTLYSKFLFSAGKRLYLNCSPNREVLQERGTPHVSKGLFGNFKCSTRELPVEVLL